MSTPYPMSKATRMEAKDNLVKWLEKGIWAERWEAYQESFLDKICHLLEMDVADFMEKNKGGNLEYQIFNAMIEDFFQLEFDQPPHNVVDDYLKRRGWKESRRDRIYIEGLRTVPFSIYAVEDVEPGQWVKVQDKILSSPIMKIQEIRGSQQINVMDYLIAKVIPYEDEFVFSGCLFLLSESVAEARAKEIRQVLEQRGFSLSQNNLKQTEQWSDIHQILNSYALRLYSDGFSKMLAPPPNLVNAEGHPLLFVETTIPVLDESRVIQFLDNDPEFNRIESDDNSIVFWDWLLLDESLTKQAESADDNSRQILTMNDEMKPVRGTLELTDEGLFCSVNAKERWDILLPKLQGLLGDALGMPQSNYHPIDPFTKDENSETPASLDLTPEEEKEVIQDFLDTHYFKMLDTPIPALKGKTPREAVKTESGKARVIKWLKYLEIASRQNNRFPDYNFDWLWQELNLSPVKS